MLFNREIDLAPWLTEGENDIELTLYNTLRNLLGPHHHAEAESYGVGPGSFTLEKQWDGETCPNYRERYSFMRFGINPVR